MWILLLFFSSLIWSQDESATERYCFSSTSATLAQSKLSTIQVRSDSLSIDGNCLVVTMKSHRRELIQKFLFSSFNDMSVAFSSENQRKEPCNLKVEKEKLKNTEGLDVKVNPNKVQVVALENQRETIEEMQIQTIKDFQLSYDQDEILGKCTPLSADQYVITLEIKKTPKPAASTSLSQGQVILMNAPPPDQETMLLKTELRIRRGEKINIGEVIKNLKEKNNSVTADPAGKVEAQNQIQKEKVFLSLQ
jgi:hypothetical protein